MELWQKTVIFILLLAAITITLYPPWVVTHRDKSNVNFFLGHRFIFSKPLGMSHIKLHDYLWSLAVVYLLLVLVITEFRSMRREQSSQYDCHRKKRK